MALPNQVYPLDNSVNEDIPMRSSNPNTIPNTNADLNSIPTAPTDSKRRFWSRIVIIIILILLLLIIAGITAAVIYLTRIKTNNVNISCNATMSTASDSFSSKSTQATNLISSINYSDLQYSQQTISAPTKMIDTFSPLAITTQSNVCLTDNPCKNEGTCQPVNTTEFICYCKKYYYGLKCEQMNGTLDSVVIDDVFTRNNWTDILAVIDVTGSMDSCARTVVEWMTYAQASTSIKMYVFFNDGDNMEDEDKKIGATGGIHYTNSSNFMEVQRIMNYAKSRGSGGDGPENDIEALLSGVSLCPTCQNIVHIADNAATPRDLVLLPKLKDKRIKVIPCQVSSYINPAFLNIAMQTNGSLHTIRHDILNLSMIRMNDTINIDSYTYRRMVDGYIRI